MAKEALNKVLEAEEAANEVITKIKKECDNKIQNVKLQADKLIKEQRDISKANNIKEINNYILKSKSQSEQFRQEVINKYKKIEEDLQNNLDKASDAILSELLNNLKVRKD